MFEILRFENLKDPLEVLLLIIIGVVLTFMGYYIVNIGNKHVERSRRITFNKVLVQRIFIGLIIFLGLLTAFRKWPILGRVFTASVIGLIIAFILNPLVQKLEKKGIKRNYAIILVYLIIVLVVVILIGVIVPRTLVEIRKFAQEIPNFANNITNSFWDYTADIFERDSEIFITIQRQINDAFDRFITNFTGFISNSASSVTTFLSNFVQNFISVLVMIMLVLIIAFYFMLDKDSYKSKIVNLVPDDIKPDMADLAGRLNEVLSEFIRGRIILAIFVGVATMILLLILRVDFAVVIGLITTIADIIPYIGPLLGFVPAFLLALMDAPIKALVVAIFYVVIQWVENNILAPKIIGSSMGLNPLFIFLSIIIGGGMFGVWGMIVSVPLFSMILVLIQFFKEKYDEKHKTVVVEESVKEKTEIKELKKED